MQMIFSAAIRRLLWNNIIAAAIIAMAVADHHRPPYGRTYETPAYHQPQAYTPAYHQPPAYGSYEQPHAYKAKPYKEIPECSKNSTGPYCLSDAEYPLYEIQDAIKTHKYGFLELYADVADLNTKNSVDRLNELVQETYLCPSETIYARPLRSINSDGKWRIIVNNVKVDYDDFTQTVRLETCQTAGKKCPLVPDCYDTKCVQKHVHHRFLVFDAYDHYFPFAIESFRLPASCACFTEAFDIEH
ncbi:unnamed protein product [Notodromas monacha]|uniref:Spaetzle domain-containing protein n=1 Tax=Notodromas monacha TaxID=399045 RepID=A0A7R9C0E6_9CRUS|nr:unnamed protein product [Notodromas monacha]CAG0923884.1 unnamed protein product [Notodromas monacha]